VEGGVGANLARLVAARTLEGRLLGRLGLRLGRLACEKNRSISVKLGQVRVIAVLLESSSGVRVEGSSSGR
jgi:hypothetical protein